MRVLDFALTDAELRARYDRLFDNCPGAFIQQSTDWAEVIRDLGPDQPIFLLCEDEGSDLGGLPLYLFKGRFGDILTSVPQPGSLGGVFLRPGLEPLVRQRVYAALIGRAREIAEQLRVIALTITTNPFEDDFELYREYLEPGLILENFTQYLPLRPAVVDGVIRMKDSKTRNHLQRHKRRAAEARLTGTVSTCDADFDAWYAIHGRRQAEVGAPPLQRELLDNIRSRLAPKGSAHFFLVKKQDDIASGALFVHHREVMDLFMISMDSRFKRDSPNWLAVATALERTRPEQVRILHWQSSPRRESGVYAFKRQWGSIEARYYFATRLFIPAAEIQSWGATAVRQAYANHYVVPFDMFSHPHATHFRK